MSRHPYTDEQVEQLADVTDWGREFVQAMVARFHAAGITLTFPEKPKPRFYAAYTHGSSTVYARLLGGPITGPSRRPIATFYVSDDDAQDYADWRNRQDTP